MPKTESTNQGTERTVSLTVVSGPDTGLSLTFHQERITVGRAPENDFVLSDGFVSGHHGAFTLTDDGELVFRDLDSRHGSLVAVDDLTFRLHSDGRAESDPIDGPCELQVGCTLIEVRLQGAEEAAEEPSRETLQSRPPGESGAPATDAGDNEQVVTQAFEPRTPIEDRLETDDERLGILFQLAGELNGLTALDDILDLVVDATFDAFPNANFFAITLVDDPEDVGVENPFFTRVRGDDLPNDDEGDAPIISSSIVEHVVEERESVLFLKDSPGFEASESIMQAEITSCLCAPLIGQRSLLGVMEVDSRGRGGMFTQSDMDLFSVLASNVAFALERAELSNNIFEMFESFVSASVDAIEARDPTTAGHSERVTRYTLEFARIVNDVDEGRYADFSLDESSLRELRYAALLHDFGKIAVPESVLQKGKRLPPDRLEIIAQRFEAIEGRVFRRRLEEEAGDGEVSAEQLEQLRKAHDEFSEKLDEWLADIHEIADAPDLEDEQIARIEGLGDKTYLDADGEERPYLTEDEVESLTIPFGTLTEEEWEEVKSHAAHSERFLDRIPWSEELERIPAIAGAHHEKLDGSGYPKGLGRDELMPQVRMLTIADIFDALTASDRPYRDAYSVQTATDILREEAASGKLDPALVDIFLDAVLPRIRDLVPRME